MVIGVAWREHGWLVIALKLYKKYLLNLLPQEHVAYSCWEDIWLMTVDLPDACAALFWITTTGRGGRHGPLLNIINARYIQVNCYGFSVCFHKSFSLKAVNSSKSS